MPMIRERLDFYVPLYNSHSIRKQKNQKHYLPTGKPRILYKGLKPRVTNYKVLIHEETLAWLEDLIMELDIDVDAYLPKSMMRLCRDLYIGINRQYTKDMMANMRFTEEEPYKVIYLKLRQRLHRIYATDKGLLYDLTILRGSRERVERFITLREDRELFEYYIDSAWQNLDLDDGRIPEDYEFSDLEEGEIEEEAL
jgi:hypothetical protein